MEQMNIVMVGHVDHGKSTVIGRLLAETGSLPVGKLEQVKNKCEKESREFEYAFLLDALKNEQSQGVTIDAARVFFKSKKRHYIIIDAPGHIEFLKNMITGAARAEAAVLVVDAKEGVKENSKRHAYMLAMLGIKQVVVCVNKMDLVNYDQDIYESIVKECSKFLKSIRVDAKLFLPVSAREGENISKISEKMSWFTGPTVLNAIDSFEKENPPSNKPFRMPVNDVYKFTKHGDDRRIVAGRVESGTVSIGDNVIFLPDNKKSTIKSIEEFNSDTKHQKSAGESTGVTLTEQIYVSRGSIMCKLDEQLPSVTSLFEASIFWMGKTPLAPNKEYVLKIGTSKTSIKVREIKEVLDASNLDIEKKQEVGRHEVASCLLETQEPIAYDTSDKIQATSRFVILDDYDITGGGIITSAVKDRNAETRGRVLLREKKWYSGAISPGERIERNSQIPIVVFITGPASVDKKAIAKVLERSLFNKGRDVYFLGIGNILRGVDADISKNERREHLRRLGEISNILLDAGMIVVTTASDLSDEDFNLLKVVLGRENILIFAVDQDGAGVDIQLRSDQSPERNAAIIDGLLKFKNIIFSNNGEK